MTVIDAADYADAMVATRTHSVATNGQGDAVDITAPVAKLVAESELTRGVATVFVVGSTAGLTTLEFEPGVVDDVNGVFESLAPRDREYRHHLRWGDDNGSSHVRAALVGPSLSIPFTDAKLVLGTWQQLVLLEFDTRPRRRDVVVQLIGE